MNYKDYEKAVDLLSDWHHARAMDCLLHLKINDLTEDERKEICDDYKQHKEAEEALYKSHLAAVVYFNKL